MREGPRVACKNVNVANFIDTTKRIRTNINFSTFSRLYNF